MLNTGIYNGKKVTPVIIRGSIGKIVCKTGNFILFSMLPTIFYLLIDGTEVPFSDRSDKQLLQDRLCIRAQCLRLLSAYHSLPKEAVESIGNLIGQFAK